MRIEKFEDIQSWQEAKKLTVLTYQLTHEQSFSRDLSLVDQIRRASVSIMANIAEGFGRNSSKEFVRFLRIANGSAIEVQSHLHVALDLGYISQDQFKTAYNQAFSVSRLIGGFIKYLTQQSASSPTN